LAVAERSVHEHWWGDYPWPEKGDEWSKRKGTIRKPPSATGLCDSDYPVRFTAKRR
jgi:hypothetical protein